MADQAPVAVDLSKYIETRFFEERPHIRGRRVPIAMIAYNARSNHWGVPELAYNFTLSESEVLAALLYYEEHKAEIDAQEVAEQMKFDEMRQTTVQPVNNIRDLDRLKEITDELIGQPCWEARFSYGDELMLEIGKQIPFEHKLMRRTVEGEWTLGLRASKWQLYGLDESVSEDCIVERHVPAIENSTIVAFDTDYPALALSIMFSNGVRLVTKNYTEDGDDLEYWELFTPHHTILKVGPGSRWSYGRSDISLDR